MPLLFIYLIKLSIGLAVAWLFYQGALRRLTFYVWNRWYLMGYTVMCFFIPAIDVQRVVESGSVTTTGIIRYIPVFHPPAHDYSWDLVISLLAAGSVILLIRLVIGWVSVRKIRGQATLISSLGTVGRGDPDRMQIYQVDEKIVPFSFGNAIYINQELHTENEYEEIILHEYVHIRQRHSVDILVAEFLCVFAWYNPFAWMIRHSIRQNLEFIADGKVLEKGFDRKGYQYHLLKVIGEPKYRLATNFNFSSLKKRIVMMNKIRSARLHLVKFLFVLPLLAVLLVAFRNQINLHAKRNGENPGKGAFTAAGLKSSRTHEIVTTDGENVKTNATGEKAKEGVKSNRKHNLSIGVRDSVPNVNESARASGGSMSISPISNGPNLYYVDGVETPAVEILKIPAANIFSIDVLKGENATPYGERGRNGVILITTKAGHDRQAAAGSSTPGNIDINMDSNLVIVNAKKDSVNVYFMRGRSVSGTIGSARPEQTSVRVSDSFKGLILLDGKEISNSTLKSLNPLKVKLYSIISGDEAIKRYGEKASGGALIIESK